MTSHPAVRIRRLPAGDFQPAAIESLDEGLLHVRTLRGGGADLNPADLVEVDGPQTLYLGEVQASRGEILVISIEHTVDRPTLQTIQQVWYGPPRE